MDSSDINVYSRRDFGKIVLAGLPLSLVLQKPDSKINGVQIGAITYSFRTIPNAEDIIKAYVDDRPERSGADVEPCRAARWRAAGPAVWRRTRTRSDDSGAAGRSAEGGAGARGRDAQVALVDLDGQVQGCPQEVRRRRHRPASADATT